MEIIKFIKSKFVSSPSVKEIIEGEIKKRRGRCIYLVSDENRIYITRRLIEKTVNNLKIFVNTNYHNEANIYADMGILDAIKKAGERGVLTVFIATDIFKFEELCKKHFYNLEIWVPHETSKSDVFKFPAFLIGDDAKVKLLTSMDGKTVAYFNGGQINIFADKLFSEIKSKCKIVRY